MRGNMPKYKKVLLKLSGEVLMGDKKYGHDINAIEKLCKDIKQVHEMGVQICMVVGGGNIFRGVSGAMQGMDRSTADHIGMLATVMNALALQSCLEKNGLKTRVLSAVNIMTVCEPYIRRRAARHMEKGRIVIFAGGTGNPFFTTDTAASLRAVEMGCDAMFKGTQVDGVYCSDPKKNSKASRLDRITYKDVLSRDLKVMDASAISLARENNIPILIFSMHQEGAFSKVVQAKGIYTVIED